MKTFTLNMKKFLLTIVLLSGMSVFAQQPGGVPDDPSLPSGGTPTNGVVGGAAALAGGISLLIGLAAGYGGLKLYNKRLEKKNSLAQ